MVNSIELQVISRILTTESEYELDRLCSYDTSYYSIFTEQIQFILDHKENYGNVPDVFTFQAQYEDIVLIQVSESLEYLEEGLRKNKQRILFLETFNKLADLGSADVTEAWDYLALQCEKASSLDSSQPMNIVKDADKRSQQIIDFNKSSRIPTGFKEIKNTEDITIFTNMNTFNNIDEKMDIHSKEQSHIVVWYYNNESTTGEFLRIKCDNVIGLSDYIENLNKKQDNYIHAHYYSLDNQEKIIYTNVLQLILQTIISTIIIIGIISSINIINASLCEREEEFKTLSRLGTTKENLNKILIYENIYIFIKATIISTILSIPIIYLIIKYMKNVIVLDKILIPYASIGLFILLLLVISMAIAIYSTKFIKEE